MTRLLIACVALIIGGLLGEARGARPNANWVPTPAQIEELERSVPQPPDGGVAAASRYYYGATVNGRRLIVGEILASGHDRTPGVHMTHDLPLIMDGGCGVINLTYDVKRRAFVGYACNGMA